MPVTAPFGAVVTRAMTAAASAAEPEKSSEVIHPFASAATIDHDADGAGVTARPLESVTVNVPDLVPPAAYVMS